MWEKRTDGGGGPRNTCRAHGLLLSDAGQLAVLVGPSLLEPGKREHSSFLKLAPYATVTWHIKFCFRSMGFRTHYPQIMAPLDMVNILSRGDLRRSRCKEGALTSPPEAGRKTPAGDAPSLYPEGRSVLLSEEEGTSGESDRAGLAALPRTTS